MADRSSTATRTGLSAAPPDLLGALRGAVQAPDAVKHRAIDRLARANDASHYLLTPQAVVVPQGAAEVARLLRASAAQGVSVTFRSGGTSLSGQAVTDGVLVDTRRYFRDVEVLDDGERVLVQPGAVIRQVNARLAPYGRKLGPDPASAIGLLKQAARILPAGLGDNRMPLLKAQIADHPGDGAGAGEKCQRRNSR